MWLTRAGASARAYSSWKAICSSMLAPRPPYSFGQPTQVQPWAAKWRSQARRSAKASCSRPGPPRPLRVAKEPLRWVFSQPRISARNSSTLLMAVR